MEGVRPWGTVERLRSGGEGGDEEVWGSGELQGYDDVEEVE